MFEAVREQQAFPFLFVPDILESFDTVKSQQARCCFLLYIGHTGSGSYLPH